jgi:hypothetical protein
MHQKSLTNLSKGKWQKGTSGNPAGRKAGSKNIASIVRELLDEDIDPRFPLDNNLKELIADKGMSYAKAIVYALMIKAIHGDVRACNSLIELQMTGSIADEEAGLFHTNKLQVEIVESKHSTTNQQG